MTIRRLIATTAAASLTAMGALAQDNAAAPGVLPATTYWGGWFAGAQVAYGTGDLTATDPNFQLPSTVNADFRGGIAGVYGGANFQDDRLVYGFDVVYNFGSSLDGSVSYQETDPDGDPLEDTTGDFKVAQYGAIRGRIGWVTNAWYIYGAGGWVRAQFDADQTTVNLDDPTDRSSSSGSGWINGWTAAIGAERKFADNWSVRGEISYIDFEDQSSPNIVDGRRVGTSKSSTDLKLFTLGIARHF